MKKTILAMTLLTGAALAQPVPPPGEPETIYSDAQRARDQETSRHVVETMLAPSYSIEDQYARWKRPICPHVIGLAPAAAFVIERRIKEVAHQVGAPVDAKDPCVANIGIIFTTDPQATLDSIANARLELVLGGKRDLKVTQPVEAWYVDFKTDYHGTVTPDLPWEDMNSAGPIPTGGPPASAADLEAPKVAANVSRLHTGLTSTLATATVLVDANQVQGMTLGTLGDYLALLSLTQFEMRGECLGRPTIANLLVAGCDAERTTQLSDVDIALMKALYQVPEMPEQLQKQRIIGAMRRSLEAQFGGS